MNKIPKITKGNDFKLSLHMTETMCNGGIVDLEGTITSVNLIQSGAKITVQEGIEENGKIKYHDIGDSTIIIAVLNPLPLGKYGVEVNGTRNSDNSDFRYFNDYVFEVVKTTADGFIPCNSTMTYSIVGANVGLATSIGGGSSIVQVQSDWEQTDSTKVDYIKNKPNVYDKPNGGIPKTDLANDVQASLNKADTAIQSLNGYATESWVTNQGYLTQHQSLDGYATQQWVTNQGYLTEHQAVDQELTSGSTNAVSSKAVYDALADNEEVIANALISLEDDIDTHTDDTTIHMTSEEKTKLSSIESGATKVIVDQELTSGSTNAVSSKAVYDVIVDNEYVIAHALTDLNTRLAKLSEDVARLLANANT